MHTDGLIVSRFIVDANYLITRCRPNSCLPFCSYQGRGNEECSACGGNQCLGLLLWLFQMKLIF